MDLVYVLVLALAVSLDSLMAGVVYGLKEIKLPIHSIVLIGLISVICTASALLSAHLCAQWVSSHLAVVLGAMLLIALGSYSLYQEVLGSEFRIQPEQLDLDNSRSINNGEALLLGLALGVDNFAAVFAAALSHALSWETPLIMGLLQSLLVVVGGYFASSPTLNQLKRHFPYLPGFTLIILGLMRLF